MDATKRFFTQAFGWSFIDHGPDYTAFLKEGVDGGFYRSEQSATPQNGSALVVFYSAKLEAAGGVVVKPIFDFPGGRRFHFTDASGNEFAVWSDPVEG